ncbi:hypothetical protein CC80DRAFT_543746 [Byssothecium circinans]|uniref:Uncharacterized protein n=1 Tax=Byssothecium circinans TaxID=147558 RepID=A0A6A5UAQ4_9PLEO|nr:hypothetical protein CC80DRAFT_543746 [Byssothecium circinans]
MAHHTTSSRQRGGGTSSKRPASPTAPQRPKKLSRGEASASKSNLFIRTLRPRTVKSSRPAVRRTSSRLLSVETRSSSSEDEDDDANNYRTGESIRKQDDRSTCRITPTERAKRRQMSAQARRDASACASGIDAGHQYSVTDINSERGYTHTDLGSDDDPTFPGDPGSLPIAPTESQNLPFTYPGLAPDDYSQYFGEGIQSFFRQPGVNHTNATGTPLQGQQFGASHPSQHTEDRQSLQDSTSEEDESYDFEHQQSRGGPRTESRRRTPPPVHSKRKKQSQSHSAHTPMRSCRVGCTLSELSGTTFLRA